jgi:hypothetical protein
MEELDMKFRITGIVSLVILTWVAPIARAEVKTEERTRVQFPGLLGGFMKVFGGKSAKEGIVEKVAVKGDRKMTTNDETAQLIDLAEEKVYQIDLKKKTYTVMTFAEMKKQMEDAMARAKEEAAKNPAAPPEPKKGEQKPEFVIDVKISESGQKKSINGFDCREVLMNVTVRPKDKTAQDGSMTMTESMWLAPKIAAMKELEDFDIRFAKKMLLPFASEMTQEMGPAMAAYPGLTEAMGKMEIEKVNMNGTAILTEVRAEVAAPPDSSAKSTPPPAQQTKQSSSVPTSIGGLLGGLGKKVAPKPSEPDTSKPGTLMSTTNELISVSTTVSTADVSIPAGFKEKK